MEVGDLAKLRELQCAYDYITRKIRAAEESRMDRYEMCGESPEGSQNSFVVSYSQDSKLSGDEPPKIEEIIGIIIETLPEMRLQQLFPFGNVDDTEARVRIAVPFLDTDLGLLNELVKEAMDAMRVSATVIARTAS